MQQGKFRSLGSRTVAKILVTLESQQWTPVGEDQSQAESRGKKEEKN